jgi:hypothetical protein
MRERFEQARKLIDMTLTKIKDRNYKLRGLYQRLIIKYVLNNARRVFLRAINHSSSSSRKSAAVREYDYTHVDSSA